MVLLKRFIKRFYRFRFYIGCLFFFLLVFCDTETHIKNADRSGSYLVGTLNLPLDSVGNYEFYWVQYIDGENEGSLAVLNKVFNSLDFYDLDTETLEKRIRLDTDEKFGKFQPSGFYYHNADSIFVYPHYTFDGTLMINAKGDMVNKISAPIPEQSENQHALNHISSPSSPSVYLNGKIHAGIASLLSSSWHSGLSPDFKTNMTLDPFTGEIRFVQHLTYPEAYLGKATTDHHSFLCRVLVENRYWIHSYPLMDSVLLYDTAYRYLGAKYAGSAFFEGFVELKRGTPHTEQYQYVIQNSSYARILYDRYRNLFYRVVLIGRKLDPSRDTDSRDNSRNHFAVAVFDENFQKIKEVVFPPEKYFHYAAFVGKKGLYIPKINKDYVELSEDLVSYGIFDFTED